MNFKVIKSLPGIIAIIFIGFSCKEPRSPGKEIEVLAPDCKVAEFTEFDRKYSFEYDATGLPIKLFRIVSGFDPILYRKFQYEGKKVTAIHHVTLEGASYPGAKFEYENDLLHMIRLFDGFSQSVSDTIFTIKEKERIEFSYGSTDKPASLIRWLSDNQGGFYKSHESKFEYNAAGNLVVEKNHTFARLPVGEADFLYEYFYDEKANTQKQLNYLFFSANDSPARLFSTNNMNRLKLSHENQIVYDQPFKLIYDSQQNIVADGYRYSGMKWICK